mgnify:CR=1 FL=1
MPKIAINQEIELNYALTGEGPPLLLIGGTGWDLRQPISPFERRLQQHFQVLRFDQRGQGQSGKPDRPYTMQDYASDAAQLLAALNWPLEQRFAVMGISFGGMVAQEFVLNFGGSASRISRLVLACTSSGGAGGSSYPIHQLQHLAPQEYAETFLRLANAKRDKAWQARFPQLYAAMLHELKSARENMSEEDWIGLQRQLDARIGHDCWDRLPQLSLPVMVCGGEDDALCPPQNLQMLASQIPGARLQIFQGGHGFYMEDTSAPSAILEFLLAG